ncbi:hypothetical protein TKK_0001078 [Trichogramma kaykai]
MDINECHCSRKKKNCRRKNRDAKVRQTLIGIDDSSSCQSSSQVVQTRLELPWEKIAIRDSDLSAYLEFLDVRNFATNYNNDRGRFVRQLIIIFAQQYLAAENDEAEEEVARYEDEYEEAEKSAAVERLASDTIRLPWEQILIEDEPRYKTKKSDKCDSDVEVPWESILLDPEARLKDEEEKPCPENSVEMPWKEILIPETLLVQPKKKRHRACCRKAVKKCSCSCKNKKEKTLQMECP